ncbi:MAG: NADH-quinone oxidoreductase subunit NuoE [Candidatus Syntrophosphaera sp.]
MEQDFSKLDAILPAYQGKKGSLIPLLQEAQAIEGYLSRPALKHISEKMDIPAAEIFGVVTFYSMFRLEPQGKHIIRVCKGTACHVADANGIKDALVENLKLEEGKTTTDDMQFTLMEVACLGCCSLSPVIMIDDQTFGKLTPEAIPGILDKFRY